MIENDLRARRENPPKRLNLYGPFAAVSLLEYGGLKPILPFLEGRSDAACRVVIQTPPVPLPPPPCPYLATPPVPLPTPYHPPTSAVPSPYQGRCTLGFYREIRGCSGPGVTHVRRWYGAEPSVPQMLGGCVGWWSGIAAFRRRCEDFSRRLQRVQKNSLTCKRFDG